MKNAQKISHYTILKGNDSLQKQYLLSLNSVFDVSETRILIPQKEKKSHIERPRWWCLKCWQKGRFTAEYQRLHVK